MGGKGLFNLSMNLLFSAVVFVFAVIKAIFRDIHIFLFGLERRRKRASRVTKPIYII
jgi:hypothetical protein